MLALQYLGIILKYRCTHKNETTLSTKLYGGPECYGELVLILGSSELVICSSELIVGS